MGKSIEEGDVGGSRDGGVDNSGGDRTIVVNENFKADREARISFPQDGGGQVRAADADEIAFGMGGRYVPGGVESPCGTGEGRRTLGQGTLNDGRDFGGSGIGGRFLSFAFAPTGSSICSNSLIEFGGATMDDIRVRMGGRGSWLGGGCHGGLPEGRH